MKRSITPIMMKRCEFGYKIKSHRIIFLPQHSAQPYRNSGLKSTLIAIETITWEMVQESNANRALPNHISIHSSFHFSFTKTIADKVTYGNEFCISSSNLCVFPSLCRFYDLSAFSSNAPISLYLGWNCVRQMISL